MMRAVQLEGSFSLDSLHLRRLPVPEPGPGEVLLRMEVAALNYRDLMIARGEYNPRWALPLVVGSDGVGVVAAVGAGVQDFALGDRVSSGVVKGWLAGELTTSTMKQTLGGPHPGVLQEFTVASAADLVRVPAHLDSVEGATLPCAGLTAWNALRALGTGSDAGGAKGRHVLIQGTGGVALFALQFASLRGARVAVVSGSQHKFDRLRALGADLVIDRRAEANWGRAVREWTGGEGVDVVVEVGGAETIPESLNAIRPSGDVAVIGILGGAVASVDLRRLLMRNVSLRGVFIGSRESFEAMNAFITRNKLRPVIDRVFPLAETREALRYLERGAHFGKVCVSCLDSGTTES